MAILLLGVLRVNPTSIRRRRKDFLAEETSISNDTLSTATNSTVNSLFHKTGPNSTDTHIGGGDFEEEEEGEGEDEEIIGETATPPSDEYDSLLRDLNAREKVIIIIQSVEMSLYDGQYRIECHYFCFSPLLTFSSICIFIASYVLYCTTLCSCLIPSYPILSYYSTILSYPILSHHILSYPILIFYYHLCISPFLLTLKVILLEGLQKGLYGMAGKIQNHLYLLKEVRQRLLREELIIISESTGELLYFRTRTTLSYRSAICTVYESAHSEVFNILFFIFCPSMVSVCDLFIFFS